MTPRPPISTLFPYTTLFRSIAAVVIGGTSLSGGCGSIAGTVIGTLIMGVLTNLLGLQNVDDNVKMMIKIGRAHAELQSRRDLVCRLLLEKKKAYNKCKRYII